MAIEVGQTAPALDAPIDDAEGNPRSIGEAVRSGPVLIGLYKSSCQASKAMFPMLERLHQRYGEDGLTVFGVSQDSPNVTRSFARRYGVTFPLLVEGDEHPVSRAFDIFATPTVYLIAPAGAVTYTTMGFLREQINDLGAATASQLGVPTEPIVGEDEPDVPLFVPG